MAINSGVSELVDQLYQNGDRFGDVSVLQRMSQGADWADRVVALRTNIGVAGVTAQEVVTRYRDGVLTGVDGSFDVPFHLGAFCRATVIDAAQGDTN